MQSSNQPAKFLIPFAQNDSAKVEIPATTTDATRFSQALGSPPLTGMPPEAGGVPPQLEDFNGALNQISRGIWWAIGGGRFAYDAAWAADDLIGGYARGAVLPAALGAGSTGMGEWYNNTDDNMSDPDANGTGWVPGYHYGSTALTSQTGGTTTLTPAQAGKRVITVAGTLTSNLVIVVPAWVYDWTVYNNTGGAFTVTVKNAATPGVVIPQNGAPTPVRSDGSAVSLWSPNIAAATSSSQAARFDQTTGRLLGVQRFTASGTYTPTPGTNRVVVELVGGGGGGGGAPAAGAAQNAIAGGGGGGAYAKVLWTAPVATTVTIGTGGTGGSPGSGTGGSATSFGSLVSVAGGSPGNAIGPLATSTNSNFLATGGGGGVTITSSGVTVIEQSEGAPGGFGLSTGGGSYVAGGPGGASRMGMNAYATAARPGSANTGTGGGGGRAVASSGAEPGGAGGSGLCVVWEYA